MNTRLFGGLVQHGTNVCLCFSFFCFVLFSQVMAADYPGRSSISLNSDWECQRLDGPTYEATGEWKPIEIPGLVQGTGYESTAFRRRFLVPEAFDGQLVYAYFGGARWCPTVFLNGIEVGRHYGGFEEFECRVDDHLIAGRTNELVVVCESWTGVFDSRDVEFPERTTDNRARYIPKDEVLWPIGGHISRYGIWDEVEIVAVPGPVRIMESYLITSWREKSISFNLELRNEGSRETSGHVQVSIAGNDVPRFEPASFSLAGGATTALSFRAPWTQPHAWSFEDPHLYTYKITVKSDDGRSMDFHRERFGFREIWIEGPDFYLNGSKIHMLAASWWPPVHWLSKKEIREQWEALRAANVNTFRTHTQPWPKIFYAVADEVGVLMIPEGAVWNDDGAYRVNDSRFWENYAAHLRAMVKRLRDHPSVVLWSLENEFYGSRLNDETLWPKAQLARMADVVRELDPTRPITYESDGDPNGAADVIGLHYPHEYPDYVAWPNEADFIEEPVEINHMFLNGEESFFWGGDKPLYVGEFLWIPSSDPSWHTVFFGDEAYRDYKTYRSRAKGEAWRMQIQGYRRHNVSGISPWSVWEHGPLDSSNPTYEACRWGFQPFAAYVREYDSRFFEDDVFIRTIDIHNDTLSAVSIVLEAGVPFMIRRLNVDIPAGGHLLHEEPVASNSVPERTPFDFTVRMKKEGKTVFEEIHRYCVYPRTEISLPRDTSVVLFDPQRRSRGALSALGVQPTLVKNLDEVPEDLDILIVGAGALSATSEVPILGGYSRESPLVALAQGGTRILILEQEQIGADVLPVNIEEHASTMTFPLDLDHPVLEGFAKTDWRFWRGDHFVTRHEIKRPACGNMKPLVVSGGRNGIGRVVVGELAVGRGTIVFCQALVSKKASSEPIASLLLGNTLHYLATFEPQFRPAAIHAQSRELVERLECLGVRADDISGHLADTDLTEYGTLVYEGDVSPLIENQSTVERFVDVGGTLWLHGLQPGDTGPLEPLLGAQIRLQPYHGPVSRGTGDSPLLAAFTNEDLYWLGEHTGPSYWVTPRANNMAYSVVAYPIGPSAETHEAEEGTVEGPIAYADDTEVVFASYGSLKVPLHVEHDDEYVIGLTARGTPLGGIWPMAELRVDGELFGLLCVESSEHHVYTCRGYIPAGRHNIVVTFTNDAQDPPREDRNLFVDRILVAKAKKSPVVHLAEPPALAFVPRGRGRILIDQIRWPEVDTNSVKADRFVSGLLTALGVEMSVSGSLVLEAEKMIPDPAMKHFRATSEVVSLGSNGWIETDFICRQENEYLFSVLAGGTACGGRYPIVEVRLDGTLAGTVELDTSEWKTYALRLRVGEGKHKLRLAFTNDAYDPPEDRNLLLDRVSFHPQSVVRN